MRTFLFNPRSAVASVAFAAWRARRYTVLLLAGALALAPGPATATHIVGGQLGMHYVSRGVYDLTFTLYFDVVNGDPGAFDSVATVVTYARGRGRAGTMDTISLELLGRTRVPYTNPNCQSAALSTDEIRYGRRVVLDPNRYAAPRGYYVAWQRSSRNSGITNLGTALVGYSGNQTFYLEFPALRRPDGSDFVNSSPTGFAPLHDYACVGRPCRYPFGGVDPDGDSLVYELATPLQYVCPPPPDLCVRPVPGPAPYPPVGWAPGFDSLHQITGPQPLRINRRTGELTFTAGQPGLFVFAVRVREYRAGRLLAELRREFQELVAACVPTPPPVLSLTAPGPPRTGPVLPDGQLITLPAPGVPGERCLNVYAIDPDTTTRLRLRVVAVDPLPSLPGFSVSTGVVNVGRRGDSLVSRLCFADCFATGNVPLRLRVIVEDEGCPQPQPDTVLLLVRAPGILGTPTTLTLTPAPPDGPLRVGQVLRLTLTATNAANLPMTVGAVDVNGGPPGAAPGLEVPTVTAPGTATTRLTWPISCALIGGGEYRIRLRAAVGEGGCATAGARDTVVTVTVVPSQGIYDPAPPNVITPNGDGLNDAFAPNLSRTGAADDCEAAVVQRFRVYNRWGREVYHATAARWDGAAVPAGTYYYLIEFENRPSLKGWLEVVR